MGVVDQDITQDFGWFIGEDKLLTFTVYAPGTTQAQIDGGTATKQNITGWTLEWVLKKNRYSATVLLSKTSGSGVTITDATNGIFTVQIAHADYSVVTKAGTYAHAAARTDTGAFDIVSQGSAVIRKAAAVA